MPRCCCGRYQLEFESFMVNDIIHQVLGPERNFCGPAWRHDLRLAEERIAALEAELAKAREQLRLCIIDQANTEAELAECRRENAELAQKYVGDLGQEVVRLGRELDECRAKLADALKP